MKSGFNRIYRSYFLPGIKDIFCEYQARRHSADSNVGGRTVYVLGAERLSGRLQSMDEADCRPVPDSIYADNPAVLGAFNISRKVSIQSPPDCKIYQQSK